MSWITPSDALALLAAGTAAAYAVELVRRRRVRRKVRGLATEWRMTYGRTDTLRLTPKVARAFPVPGAARVRVSHVIYGRDPADPGRYRYVFTAEYTAGVVQVKRRFVRVGTWSEPRDRARGGPPGPVVLAPADLPLIEQYRRLAPDAAPGPV